MPLLLVELGLEGRFRIQVSTEDKMATNRSVVCTTFENNWFTIKTATIAVIGKYYVLSNKNR